MSLPSLRLALVAGLVLPLGLATGSFAQDAAAPAPGAADPGAQHHHLDPAQTRAHMADHLRAVLQLQPGQDVALNAYLDALKPADGVRAGGMKDRHDGDRGEMQHMTTPERLDRMAARLDVQRTRMLAKIAATKHFYAQLSPSQQKAFDDLAPMMMHRGGHGMGGHGDARGDGHGGWGRDRDDGMGSGGPPRG